MPSARLLSPITAIAALLVAACSSDAPSATTGGATTTAITTGAGGSGGASGGAGGAGGSAGGMSAGGAGGGATGGHGGGAGACALTKPYSSKNQVCNACAEQYCCPQINACYADPACDDGYVNCAIGCAIGDVDAGIDPCLAECAKQFPGGRIEYDAAIGCADTECAIECQ